MSKYSISILIFILGSMWFMLAGISNSGCADISEGVFLDACNSQRGWMTPTFLVIGFLVCGVGIYFFMTYGEVEEKVTLTDMKSPLHIVITDNKYENWSDEWREFQIKKDRFEEQRQRESQEILKKYSELPELKNKQPERSEHPTEGRIV